jgi:hypothetical protein
MTMPPALTGSSLHDDLEPIPPELLPDLEQFVIDDGKPVDNVFTEKQQALLRGLYDVWPGPGEGRPFQLFTDVGLHFAVGQPSLSPDVMLSLDIVPGQDMSRRENRSYFIWLRGKAPDLVIEFVPDRRGDELTLKLRTYARWGIPYYAVFDPACLLGAEVLQTFCRVGVQYEPLPTHWFAPIGLGLTLWDGTVEGMQGRWLRWCNEQGQLIPTAQERLAQAQQDLDRERPRRQQLEARLRELGVEP